MAYPAQTRQDGQAQTGSEVAPPPANAATVQSGGGGGGVNVGDPGAQRRHQRINAPMDVVMGGKAWRALDWSMTGFAVPPNALSLDKGGMFSFHGRFHVQGALLTLEMRAQVARRTADRVGCRFEEMGEDQMRVLRLIHSAYRSDGDASTESIMEGLARDAQSRRRDQALAARGFQATAAGPDGDLGEDGLFSLSAAGAVGGGAGRLRRGVAQLRQLGATSSARRLIVASAYAAVMVLFLAVSALSVLRIVGGDIEAEFAAVYGGGKAPAEALLSTKSGQVLGVSAQPGDFVGPRSVLMRVEEGMTSDPREAYVLAGCACQVHTLLVGPGERVVPGQPLAELVPLDPPQAANPALASVDGLLVEALFKPEVADLLRNGAGAQVVFSGVAGQFPVRLLPEDVARQLSPGTVGAGVDRALPLDLAQAIGDQRLLFAVSGAPRNLAAGHPARIRVGAGLF